MGVCKHCKPFTILSVFSRYRWLWSSTVKKFFEGISISQIIAGSLAAVTSFFLAGKIGVAGSTIGAAASYIISTVAGKVYQNVLKASGEKLQAAGGTQTGSDKQGEAAGGTTGATEATGTTTGETDGKGTGTEAGKAAEAEKTADDTEHLTKVGQPRSVASSGALSIDSGKDGEVHTFAQVRHRNVKRMAIIVSLISGLVGVAITAGVVLLFTQGKGTDTVVRDMTSHSSVTDTPSDGSTDNRNQYGTGGSDSYGYGTDSKKPGSGSTDSSTSGDSSDSSSQSNSKQNSNSGGSSSKGNSNGSTDSGSSSNTGGNSSQNGGSSSTDTNGGSSNSGNSGSSSGSGGSNGSTDSSGSGTSSGTDSGSSSGTNGTTGSTTSGN